MINTDQLDAEAESLDPAIVPAFSPWVSRFFIGLAWVPVLWTLIASGWFLNGIGAVSLLLVVGLGYALWYGAILVFWLFLAFLAIRFIKAAWSW